MEMRSVISRIWQVIVWNGQRKRIAMLVLLAPSGVAVATTATFIRAFAAAIVRLVPTVPTVLGHFYICNAEQGTHYKGKL